jgi:hypothetical protein
VNCASARSTSPPSLSPAAPGELGLDLGWEVLGVPSSRGYINYAMTWDIADGYVVLFGGSNTTGSYLGDTWTYKSGVWTQLTPLVGPTARDSSGLAYSAWDDGVLLFGGYTPGTGGFLNDTWIFKGGVWTEMRVNGPSPRNGFGLVYDPTIPTAYGTNADVLFGGYSPECGTTWLCNDTWYWIRDSWLHALTPAAPPGRYQLSMTFDPIHNQVVMFGGYGGSGCLAGGECNDTWQFNASTAGWVQVGTPTPCGNARTGPCPVGDAPTARDEASFAWDTADGYAVLLGGRNQTNTFGDTWKYSAGTWTQLNPTEVPAFRYGAALTFDPSAGDNYLLLYGGDPPYFVEAQRTFVFTAGNWQLINPPAGTQPEVETGGMMTYDAADGYVLLFGGYSNATGTGVLSSETWKYSGGVWTLLSAGGPPALEWASIDYDPSVGYVVLFGGFSPSGFTDVTWGYLGGNWFVTCQTSCNGFAPPSSRELSAMAYDPVDGAEILFGGFGGLNGHSFLGDTWAYLPYGAYSAHTGYWVNESLSPAPASRAYAAMTWDGHDDEILLYGGYNGTSSLTDLWVLPRLSSGWSQPTLCGGPAQPSCVYPWPGESYVPVFVYDTLAQVVVWSEFGSTYFYQGGQWRQCLVSDTCFSYYGALSPENGYASSTYDAADGYVIAEGGYGTACGNDCHLYYQQYPWVLGDLLWSQGPGFAPQYVDMGGSVTFTANVVGGGIGTYSLEWSGLPRGCAPPSAQVLTFSCSVSELGFGQYYNYLVYGGYFDPSVVVVDSSGFPSISSPQSYSWLNDLWVAPDLKVQINSSASVADVGQTVYFRQVAVNGWGPFTYYWNNLPPGCATVNTTYSTQLVKCTLGANAVGTWLPFGTVVDFTGYNALSATLALTVDPAANATAVVVNTAALDAGQTLSIGVTPSGGSGVYTFSWTGVPAACLANAAVLTCAVPSTETGRYDPSVTMYDSNGATVSRTYAGSVLVSAPPSASDLTLTNASGDPTSAIDLGQSVTFALTSTVGSGGDTITWSGLPAGCAPSGTNATSVACVPTATGSYSVAATITDSNGASATSSAAALDIAPALSDGRVAVSSSAVTLGQALTVAVTFSGGSGGVSFTWSGLPAGCVAGNAASVTCTPTAVGNSTPTVVLRDANGRSLSVSATGPIVVSASPPPPAAAAAPFATSFQWLELALLAALILLALVAILLVIRRPPPGGPRGPPPPPPGMGTSVPPPPPGASDTPDYHES